MLDELHAVRPGFLEGGSSARCCTPVAAPGTQQRMSGRCVPSRRAGRTGRRRSGRSARGRRAGPAAPAGRGRPRRPPAPPWPSPPIRRRAAGRSGFDGGQGRLVGHEALHGLDDEGAPSRCRRRGSSPAFRRLHVADGVGARAPSGAPCPVLQLPDGHGLLQRVDEEPAPLEGLRPVGGRDQTTATEASPTWRRPTRCHRTILPRSATRPRAAAASSARRGTTCSS